MNLIWIDHAVLIALGLLVHRMDHREVHSILPEAA
jgi:hypothetical protein